jgi:phosphopantetheinyl transferase
MPLIYQQHVNPSTRLGLWHLAEDEKFFLGKVEANVAITHPHKRLQHLAGRYLLKELYEDFPLSLIRIADTRKPFLKDEAYHFSISHCGDYAAAIVSSQHRVGVDIEIPHEKILAIARKFLTDSDRSVIHRLGDEPYVYTMAWSIKEAVFKWFGNGQVDFRDHIQLLSIAQDANVFEATCLFTRMEDPVELRLDGLLINGNCLCWLVT